MPGSSSSVSTGQSTGISTPTIMNTPETAWGMQLSKLLSALGENQYNWAMGEYNRGSQITDGMINNYMDLAGRGAGLAQDLLEQYKNVFEPIMNQYVQQAGTYNSENRQRFMAGQAESTVAQADQAARDEAERQLQGYGINPNSGRYQDLLLSSRIKDAAARAGAGTQASLDTAAIGRQMTQNAAQMGQNVPGMTVNALQSAYTGVTGGENALLGMLNTGANLTQSAVPFFNTSAGAIKLPPVGNTSQQQSTQASKSGSTQLEAGKSDSGNQGSSRQASPGGGNQRSPGDERSPSSSTKENASRGAAPGRFGQYQPGPAIQDLKDWQQYKPSEDELAQQQLGELGSAPDWSQYQPGDEASSQWSGEYSPEDQQQINDWGSPDWGSYQPGDAASSQWSGEYSPEDQQQINDWGSADQYGGNEDYSQYDTSGNYGSNDAGGNYSGDTGSGNYSEDPNSYEEYYAQGGRVRPQGASQGATRGVLPTSGGNVPRSASPSRGRQTDDVQARLNAGEFVVPRDVVAHKGSEFFQKLIAQSRKNRTGMAGPPTGAKMKPALRLRPSFVSHQV